MRDDNPITPLGSAAPDLEALERFLAGEGTPDEHARVRAWAGEQGAQGHSHADDVRTALAVLAGGDGIAVEARRQLLRRRLGLAELGAHAAGVMRPSPKTERFGAWPLPKLRRSGRGWLWAAGIAGVAVGVFLLSHYTTLTAPPTAAPPVRSYATRADQQATLTLAHGTRIVLAPGTRLRLIGDAQSPRIVELDAGTAYFAVSDATTDPFIVQSGRVSARVLGTEFLVRHDAGDARVRVGVASGKVQVTTASRAGHALILAAGEVGSITDSTERVRRVSDVVPNAEWEPGYLLFRHVAVATVLRTLSEWYGYEFRYSDPEIARRMVTIGVSTQSPAEALSTLEQVLAVSLTVTGDTVMLMPQSPRPTRTVPRVRTYDTWTPTREVGQ